MKTGKIIFNNVTTQYWKFNFKFISLKYGEGVVQFIIKYSRPLVRYQSQMSQADIDKVEHY